MPAQDSTGPQGKGPRTGRQRGKCADVRPAGRGFGNGRGGGLGRGK